MTSLKMTEGSESSIKHLYCVEFPGKVVNTDRAIQCLGGLNKISNAFADPQVKLECRFRPDDSFSKSTIANQIKSTSFVLKVLVKKKKYNAGGNENVTVCASVIGKVEQVFRFCNLNDFQYLPMERSDNGVYESIHSKLIPKSFLPLSWECQSTPFFFPPTLFSRTDSVQPYITSKVTEESSGLIGRTRDRRSNYVKFVSHDLKEVPCSPNQNTLRYIKLKFVTEEQILRMKELFDERPVWTKSALECVTRYPELQLKYLLAMNAYHFTSGPYRIAWVRFGYDPRKDSSSKKYQVLDYRLRSFVLASMRERLPERFSRGIKTKIVKTINDEKIVDPFDESYYKFRPGLIPPQKQIFYQICDIEIPEIQEKLDNFSEKKSYDSKNGWLTELFLEKVREAIDKQVLAAVSSSNEGDAVQTEFSPLENVEIKHDDSTDEMDFNDSDQDNFMNAED